MSEPLIPIPPIAAPATPATPSTPAEESITVSSGNPAGEADSPRPNIIRTLAAPFQKLLRGLGGPEDTVVTEGITRLELRPSAGGGGSCLLYTSDAADE